MKNLYEAITTQFLSAAGSDLRVFVGKRMTLGQAPAGTKHPLIELVTGSGSTEPTLSPDLANGARLEITLVDFVIQSVKQNNEEAWDIAALLKTLYDGQILSLGATQNMVNVERQGPGAEVQDLADDSWNIIVTYEYTYG